MKRHSRLTLAACSLMLALASCGDSTQAKELRDSTAETWGKFKAYAIAQRDELAQATDERLEELDARVQELKGDLGAAGEELRGKVQKLRASAGEKLEALDAATEENWEKAKAELIAAVEELERAAERLRER